MFPSNAFLKKWTRLLQDRQLAKEYWQVYALDGAMVARNPFLDELLSSFVFLRLLSLLDDALEEVAVSDPAVVFPKKKPVEKQDLFDKIDALAKAGYLTTAQADQLQAMRKWRNNIAHEPHPTYLDLSQLEQAFTACDAAVRHLGMTVANPTYEFFAERATQASDDPNVLTQFTYQVGLKENGVPEMTLHWTSKIFKDGVS